MKTASGASANVQSALTGYSCFAAGDIPGICDLYADPDNADIVWYGDRGMQKFSGMNEFAAKTLSRFPEHWPTFKIAPQNVVMETNTQVMFSLHATTENGMDTEFLHYWEFNAEGKVIAVYLMDDSAAWAKYDIKPEEPSAAELELCGKGGGALRGSGPVGASKAVSETATANEKTARKGYELFSAGDIPGIVALFEDPDGSAIHWYGDTGLQKFAGGFNEFTAKVLSRIPVEWPTFKIKPSEVIMESGNKLLFKCHATTENGMNTDFFHTWEFNEEGKVIGFTTADDGVSFSKNNIKAESAVAEKNLATLHKLHALEEKLAIGVIDEKLMAEAMEQMKSCYAQKISLKMMPNSKALSGLQSLCMLEDLTVDEFFASIYKQFGGFKNHKVVHTHCAVDRKSGGSVIMASQVNEMSLVDADGTEIPGTKHDNFALVAINTFDKAGKIAALEWQFDTLLVEDMKKRAAQHGEETVEKADSWVQVAERNLATIERHQELRRQMAGVVIDKKLLAELSKEVKGFYAPKISLSLMPNSKSLSEHQSLCHHQDVTVDEFFAAIFKQWSGMKHNKVTVPYNAVDMKGGGKVILSCMVNEVAFVDSVGVEIPGTKQENFVMMHVHKFDDYGKIIAVEVMFDTLLVESMKKVAMQHEDTVIKAGA